MRAISCERNENGRLPDLLKRIRRLTRDSQESAQGRSATLVATDARFALLRDQIQDISKVEDCEAPSQPRCLLWGHVRRGLPWPPVCPLPLCSVRDSRPAQGALMLLSTLRNRRSQIRSGVRANQLPRGVSRAEQHFSSTLRSAQEPITT